MALPMAPQIYWYGILWICLGSEETTQLNNWSHFYFQTPGLWIAYCQGDGSLAQQAAGPPLIMIIMIIILTIIEMNHNNDNNDNNN